MSVQNIIDKAQQIEIDRRRIVGQTMSRSQRIKTAERATAQPWKFKITPPGSLPWTASRGFIEVINLNDRVAEYQISLSNSAGTRYITSYMGELTQGQLNALDIQSVGTSSFVITNLPSVSSSTVVFAKGDLIQPENSRYPYAVVDTVVRGLTTTTSVTLHRPIITSEGVTLSGQGLAVGNSCTWRVVVSGLPTFQLIPMQQVQYTGDFELIERII
jgi:hypothetical protein